MQYVQIDGSPRVFSSRGSAEMGVLFETAEGMRDARVKVKPEAGHGALLAAEIRYVR